MRVTYIAFLLLTGIIFSGETFAAAPKAPAFTLTAYSWSKGAETLPNIVPFHWLTIANPDPARAKAATDAMPPGRRALFSWDLHRDIDANPKDMCKDADGKLTDQRGIWWDNGVEEIRNRFETFFKEYKRLGGELDVFVLDFEGGMSNWMIDAKRFKAIETDPRFPEIAKKLGFSDLTTVAEFWKQPGEQHNRYLIWNELMQVRTAEYLNQAIYAPMRKYFPNAKFSNFGFSHHSKDFPVPEENGHADYLFGNGARVGTDQAPCLYASFGQLEMHKLDGKNAYAKTPFNGFRYAINRMRSMANASPAPISPWIGYKEFKDSFICNHDLYQELIFHVGLCGADDFLLWNPRIWAKDQNPAEWASDKTDKLVSDCLLQLDKLIGFQNRRTLSTSLAPWVDDFLLSGMNAGGRSVWRFTPKLSGEATVESTLVCKYPATFKVGRVTVTIPGGRIITPEVSLSNQGYWITAPENAVPAVKDGAYHPALNPVTFQPAPEGDPLPIVKDGAAQAVIVIAKTAFDNFNSMEFLAARELRSYIRFATDIDINIVSDDNPAPGNYIFVGESNLTKARKVNADDLAPEGFRVQSLPGCLVIIGHNSAGKFGLTDRGTLFGVYDVLERYLGIRWYYPGDDGQVIPHRESLAIDPVHYTDAPVRIKRTMDTFYAPKMGPDADFNMHQYRYRLGVSTPISTACHTPANFGIHFKDHPECFEMDLDGKRIKTMPCYGNPKTVEIMMEDLEAFYTKGVTTPWLHPDGVNLWFPPTATTVHISPPDKPVECNCEFCKKLTDPDADRLARTSRLMADFVARYAAEVKKRWPDKTVFYLPYSNYTLPPTGVTFPDNVVTGIALMYGAANGQDPAFAKAHDDMMSGWGKITGHKVHLWEYLCWPAEDTSLPYQYPHVLRDFQQRHRDDLDGTFVNGPAGPPDLPGGMWAFQTPTLYCWFRVMWNPDFDVDAALEEYVEKMYGPAAKPMGDMLTTLTERWEKARRKDPLNGGNRLSPKFINEEVMPRYAALGLAYDLQQARELTGADTVERRRVDFFGHAVELFLDESRRYHEGGLPALPILRVGANPKIDGMLDEPCWRDAQAMPFKNALDSANPAPKQGTTVQGVWTNDGITFAFRLTESEMTKLVAKRTVRDQDVYSDDCIEIFLDVVGQRSSYYQVVTNSIGAIFDMGSAHPEWNANGVKSVAVKGDKFWTLEVYLPFADFPEKPVVKTGDIWYGNFCRTRMVTGNMELQRWSTFFRGSNHDFNAFGQLRFVE